MFWSGGIRPPCKATAEQLRTGDTVRPDEPRPDAGAGIVQAVNGTMASVKWFGKAEDEWVLASSLLKVSRLAGKVYQDQFGISFGSGNIFFATALNAQEFDGWDLTHLVSLHNDVVPEVGWIDILMDELERTGADFLSAVLPIKDLNGLSSTAIDSTDDPFCVERRLTMSEVHSLPETFTAADCGYPDRPLLVNTGCWIMDFTKDWRKLTHPDGSLMLNCTSPDRIKRRPPDQEKSVGSEVIFNSHTGKVVKVVGHMAHVEFDSAPDGVAGTALIPVPLLKLKGHAREAVIGRWEAQHSPADWFLSRHLHSVGAKVMATRKVRAVHIGDMPYQNMEPWGRWTYDEALGHKFGRTPINTNGEHRNGQSDQSGTAAASTAGDTAGGATSIHAVAQHA